MSTLTQRAAKKAYETAGIGPKDIALTEARIAGIQLLGYENPA